MPAPAELEAAWVLLARLGITPEALVSVADSVRMPTIAEYLDCVEPAVSAGARRAYGTCWARLRQEWGSRRLDEPTPTEIKRLAERVKASAVVRANARGGRSAAEHLIASLRCRYRPYLVLADAA